MARTVKCCICKTVLEKDSAYKINQEAARSRYCCSKIELDIYERNKAARVDLVSKIQELIGSEVSYSLLNKELKILTDKYQSPLILSYVEDNFIELDILLSKDFQNSVVKLKYLSAIITNNLPAYKKSLLENRKVSINTQESSIEIIENIKFKPRKKRKTLEEYINEY